METTLSKDNLELHVAFGIILSIETFSNCIIDIAELIYNSKLDRNNLNKILKEYKINRIEDLKEELLDLLIVYINLILNDNTISDIEKQNIKLLKIYFKIKEGDFYKYRKEAIKEILDRQFERLYEDNKIDETEELHNVGLQELFDLGYDNFDAFKEKEVINAMDRGADISDLDTVKYPKVFKLNSEVAGRSITKQVMIDVWNRDGGKCAVCGSKNKLEYDHIIPFSKGGTNTFRNIQLLCENCNRKKSGNIGN